MRKIDPITNVMSKDEGFEFNVSEDPQYNQKRYEALGEVIISSHDIKTSKFNESNTLRVADLKKKGEKYTFNVLLHASMKMSVTVRSLFYRQR